MSNRDREPLLAYFELNSAIRYRSCSNSLPLEEKENPQAFVCWSHKIRMIASCAYRMMLNRKQASSAQTQTTRLHWNLWRRQLTQLHEVRSKEDQTSSRVLEPPSWWMKYISVSSITFLCCCLSRFNIGKISMMKRTRPVRNWRTTWMTTILVWSNWKYEMFLSIDCE